MSATPGDWIRRYHPAPEAKHRLVCLPHAGGSASYFFPVSRALTPAIEVLAVQYPGRQDRRSEPLIDDIGKLAELIVPELDPWSDKPLALFGHSMGASLGFEIARRLEASGRAPLALFASGRRAPSRTRDETVHLLPDAQLIADVRRLSGTQSELLMDDEIMQLALPSIRNDYKAAETYRYVDGPKLSCPIVAFTGDQDPKATDEEVQAWGAHTSGAFAKHVYPGGHFFLNEHSPALLNTIKSTLG